MRDAVIVAEAKTQRVVLWNPAATRMFGYSRSEALELRIEALVPEDFKVRHRRGIARYPETGNGPLIDSDAPLELPAEKKDSEEIHIELSLSPVSLIEESHDSESRFVLAIIRDITERKRAEEEIRKLNEELDEERLRREGLTVSIERAR